jgi:O-antigen/teichoic acid export membrane protein
VLLVQSATLLAIVSPLVLRTVTAPFYHEAYVYVLPVALGGAVYGIAFVATAGIHVSGKSEYAALCTLVAALCNLGLNQVLVARVGAMGSAIAFVASCAVLLGLRYWISQRLCSVPYPLKRTALGTGLILAVYVLVQQVPGNLWVRTMLRGTVALVLGGVIILLLAGVEDRLAFGRRIQALRVKFFGQRG